MFIYPIYNHNWRNISTIYTYITRLAPKEIFSPSNKIHREVGQAKDLSAPLYTTVRQPHIEHVESKLLLHCCNILYIVQIRLQNLYCIVTM